MSASGTSWYLVAGPDERRGAGCLPGRRPDMAQYPKNLAGVKEGRRLVDKARDPDEGIGEACVVHRCTLEPRYVGIDHPDLCGPPAFHARVSEVGDRRELPW